MADILIRGMEMPKLCCECPLKESMYDVGYICLPRKEPIKVNLYKGIDDACPLVPLPEGHGRIVDAAEILEKANNSPWFDGDVAELGLLLGSEVTTIVPAEGGGEA